MPYTVLKSIRQQNQDLLKEQFALDVLMGFSAETKHLPSKYFYDSQGSRLFEKITDLEEYYPTACELEILGKIGGRISSVLGDEHFEIVELGAGDGRKTKVLLSQLLNEDKNISYIPVDICESAVSNLVGSLEATLPHLDTRGMVGDYMDSINHLDASSRNRKLVLFLGSNIGNFDCLASMRFLRTLWKRLKSNDLLLLGFDLKKDIQILQRAYNDTKGLTRQFNLNVLARINRELDGEFELDRFSHHGLYNPMNGAMESYLVSLQNQRVYIGGTRKTFQFDAYEAIHLEFSFKYLLSDIEFLAASTGFEIMANWQDSRGYFVDSLWQVKKDE
ncbi:MAG: L-histidine N(alpha)-methyltransferase [Pseudohongiellaceae bacterium]